MASPPPPLVVIVRASSSNVFLVAAILLHFSFHVSVAQNMLSITCGVDGANSTEYTYTSAFSSNLDDLLASLSADATRKLGFSNATVGLSTPSDDVVYGLFLCRGDVSPGTCGNCVDTARSEILKGCRSVRQAAIWYDECLLRYSNRSFPFTPNETQELTMINHRNMAIFTDGSHALQVLGLLIDDVAKLAANDQSPLRKFAAKEAPFSAKERLYSLAQCIPNLSSTDCQICLRGAISQLKSCCEKMQGGRVYLYSCNIRYEVYPFYNQNANTAAPPPHTGAPPPHTGAPPPHAALTAAPPPQSVGNRANTIKIKAVVSVLSVTAAIGIICFLSRIIDCKWKTEATEELLMGDLGQLNATNVRSRYQDSNTEMQYFNLASISDATNNFSEENKLGQGGFGPVYKGKLQDGKEIAVKRLWKNSGQRLQEFETEVLLIVKLQHKNLVRLLGCCIEKGEKLLVYEYMPNTSLDAFLFDEIKSQKLGWSVRANIVNGIARGLLYLHEDSRLKIIHRDLKASNILLDNDMNPKISDFGTARIFGGNQIEESTSRVVGTYGYMSPEYAMDGLFSIKSDVYSYGVLLLEILSGKKISNFHQGHAQGLLAYAWQIWNEGKGLELIDINLLDHYPESVALKWIHIALLCIQEDPGCRPTMSSVIFMLGGELLNLPRPSQPPLFGRYVMHNQFSSSNSVLSSIKDVSTSDQYPR